MEYNNSDLSNSIECQNDDVKYSRELVPEILPQIIGENIQDNHSIIELDSRNLPNIIAEQSKTLNDFCKQKIEAEKKAKEAKEKADEAKKKEVGLFSGKKVAIEELQGATVSISEALESLTEAVNQSYINQKKIADVNRYLLGLGLTNTTLNRMVIRELEMKLNNASPKELSELAKQELMSVLRQLKAQEDIQNRLEKQAEGLRLHDEMLEKYKYEFQAIIEKENNLKSELDQVSKDSHKKLESDIKKMQEEVSVHITDKIKDVNKTILKKENDLRSSVNQVKEDFNRELKSEINDLRTKVVNHISSQIENVIKNTTEIENNLKSSVNHSNTDLNNKLDSNVKRLENLINDTLESYKREKEIFKNEANSLHQKFLKLQGRLKWYSVVSVAATAIAVISLII